MNKQTPAASHSNTATTKNVQLCTTDSRSPLARNYKRMAAAAGIWCRTSHGSIWCRESEQGEANAIFKIALARTNRR